jgi:hypothetical protein
MRNPDACRAAYRRSAVFPIPAGPRSTTTGLFPPRLWSSILSRSSRSLVRPSSTGAPGAATMPNTRPGPPARGIRYVPGPTGRRCTGTGAHETARPHPRARARGFHGRHVRRRVRPSSGHEPTEARMQSGHQCRCPRWAATSRPTTGTIAVSTTPRGSRSRAGHCCPEEHQRRAYLTGIPSGRPRASGPSGPTPGAASSWISDFRNYTDPENDPLIPHTPSFGRPSLADLARQLSDADAQSRPGSQPSSRASRRDAARLRLVAVRRTAQARPGR